jgi:hypothetical protein
LPAKKGQSNKPIREKPSQPDKEQEHKLVLKPEGVGLKVTARRDGKSTGPKCSKDGSRDWKKHTEKKIWIRWGSFYERWSSGSNRCEKDGRQICSITYSLARELCIVEEMLAENTCGPKVTIVKDSDWAVIPSQGFMTGISGRATETTDRVRDWEETDKGLGGEGIIGCRWNPEWRKRKAVYNMYTAFLNKIGKE